MKTLNYHRKLGIKAPLRGYQRKAVALGCRIPHIGLLMDPRLGKTRCAIAIAGYRFKHDGARRWIIACPKIAQEVWESEIRDVLDIPCEVQVVTGKADERRATLHLHRTVSNDELTVWIINHEASWRLKKVLYKMAPDIVTVDESHRIKNHAAKQSRSLAVLGRRARFRQILTGTFMSSPLDPYAQMQFLDPEVFDTNWAGFRSQYVKSYGFGGYKPKTYKNLNKMMELISPLVFQLTRDEAGEFPSIDREMIPFELTGKTLQYYREMEEEFFTQIRGHDVEATTVLVQALRLQQITGGFVRVDKKDVSTGPNDRIKAVSEWLDRYSRSTPIVFVARFIYELESLAELCKRMKRTSTTIRGGVNKDAAKKEFMSGRVDTCLIQIQSGIAIDLSRATTLCFYSTNGSLIDYEQSMSRVIKAGDHSVTISHVYAKDTVDQALIEGVSEKRNISQALKDFIKGR